MRTPAQVDGHPNFVDDWPVQGPTDEGLRAADCWWRNNVLPTQPACIDCKGPIPMWASQSLSYVRGQSSGIGERLSYGGRGAIGFAIGAPGSPDVWSSLNLAQQTWIRAAFVTLNNQIFQTTGTSCPGWVAPTMDAGITPATVCFQNWFNSVQSAGAPVAKLRTDGVFDQDTLNALITTAQIHSADFPVPYPVTGTPGTTPAATTPATGLSTGEMVGIGAAGVGALDSSTPSCTDANPSLAESAERKRHA